MILKIDYLSGIAAYKQIIEGVKEEIARGNLSAMDELPSVRSLAVQVKVNPNTVARAYRELMSEGVLFSRQGMGVYVRPSEKMSPEFLREQIKKVIIEAKVNSVDRNELEKLIDDILTEIYSQKTGE